MRLSRTGTRREDALGCREGDHRAQPNSAVLALRLGEGGRVRETQRERGENEEEEEGGRSSAWVSSLESVQDEGAPLRSRGGCVCMVAAFLLRGPHPTRVSAACEPIRAPL